MIKNLLFLLSSFFLCSFATAQITLPRLISDGMVLQRDTELQLWGWASPDEKIILSIDKEKYSTKANAEGNWSIDLPPHAKGGPFEINLKGKNTITLKDVLFGDVWICSGQSNMVINMERIKEKYPNDIATANYPEIRNYFIKTSTNLAGPQKDLNDGKWIATNPETVNFVSGIAFFFARELYNKYQVPIGIINASVGGTPIQSWISEEGLQKFPDLAKKVIANKDTAAINQMVREGKASIVHRPSQDKGLLESSKWFEENYVAKNWQNIHIPGFWEDQGLRDLNGVVWYRKEIEIPKSMTNAAGDLYMGRIVDADEVYVNGEKIGNITYQYPPRRYNIRKGLLKEGKNTIVIRVSNYSGKGGFVPDKKYYLTTNNEEIDLSGNWHYKVGDVFKPLTEKRFSYSYQNQPTSLYNAMLAPLTSYKAKGIIWNQGESNTGNPAPYTEYLPALINDWRSKWGQEELPFLYVQLANFMERDMLPVESNWAVLRDAQRKALSVSKTAMATTIDLGEWNDIHPLSKADIGIRLSKAARNLAYGEKDLIYMGPNYSSHEVVGNKIVLSFEHVGDGLTSIDNEPLSQFSIAGFDQKYVWANAKIVGNKIEVSSPEVTYPMYVRYAWADNPFGANLYNKNGFPASPFQTNTPLEEGELWYGKKAAVVLTYDDALNVHLDNAIPALDKHGLKGSFYLTAFTEASKNRIPEWRVAAEKGHELGNHTLYHPCDASLPGRDWVSAEKDLSKYSTERILNEIKMTNVFLEAIDGKKERTFAYTCGDTKTSEGSFIDAIKKDFIASRGVRPQLNEIGKTNLQNVDCYVVNGQTGEELIEWVKKAEKNNALLTILFHGVGGEHGLNVSLEAHEELLDYLEKRKQDIWTTTFIEAAKHVKKHQK